MPDDIELEFVRDLREHLAADSKAPGSGRTSGPGGKSFQSVSRAFASAAPACETNPAQRRTSTLTSNGREASALPEPGVEKILEFPQNVLAVDAEIGPPAALGDEVGHLDAETLERGAEGLEILDSAAGSSRRIRHRTGIAGRQSFGDRCRADGA